MNPPHSPIRERMQISVPQAPRKTRRMEVYPDVARMRAAFVAARQLIMSDFVSHPTLTLVFGSDYRISSSAPHVIVDIADNVLIGKVKARPDLLLTLSEKDLMNIDPCTKEDLDVYSA